MHPAFYEYEVDGNQALSMTLHGIYIDLLVEILISDTI